MDFSLSEDEQVVSALARKILSAQRTPGRFDPLATAQEAFDRETWQVLAKANLLGVAVPEAFGGSELGFFALCCVLQEVGRAVTPVPALETLAAGALAIAKFGTHAQKQEFLPGVCDGSLLLSAAWMDEFVYGETSVALKATHNCDEWRLSGTRQCVAYAKQASRIVLPVSCAEGTAVFLLDPNAPGVRLDPLLVTTGEPWCTLTLRDVCLLDSDLLGRCDQGAEILKWILDRTAVAICAKHLGVVERALEMTARYTSEREQFGRKLATFQAVAQRAADAFIQIEAMRLTFWEAASLLEAERDCTDAVRIAKYWACEAGSFVAYAAQHLHGGIGVALDYPLHRHYLWSRQLELSLGSAPEHLAAIGAALATGETAATLR